MAKIWKWLKHIGWTRLTLIFVGVLLLRVLWTLLGQIGFGLPGSVDFYLHRGKYQSIVAQVKAHPLAKGTKMCERVEGYRVDVERYPSGSYVMTITTRDWGHLAAYGYVFGDAPITNHPSGIDAGFSSVDNPGDMPVTYQGDFPLPNIGIIGQGDHWWSVYNPMT